MIPLEALNLILISVVCGFLLGLVWCAFMDWTFPID